MMAMIKYAMMVLSICMGSITDMCAQKTNEIIMDYIKEKSSIKEGGSNIYSYERFKYVISVAPVVVGTKSETECKTVGATKAKREMLAFVNGSEITSYTELEIQENTIDCAGERQVESVQTFTESIREEVMGHINGINHLGGWYSDDKSVYYYAIYKIIE